MMLCAITYIYTGSLAALLRPVYILDDARASITLLLEVVTDCVLDSVHRGYSCSHRSKKQTVSESGAYYGGALQMYERTSGAFAGARSRRDLFQVASILQARGCSCQPALFRTLAALNGGQVSEKAASRPTVSEFLIVNSCVAVRVVS